MAVRPVVMTCVRLTLLIQLWPRGASMANSAPAGRLGNGVLGRRTPWLTANDARASVPWPVEVESVCDVRELESQFMQPSTEAYTFAPVPKKSPPECTSAPAHTFRLFDELD